MKQEEILNIKFESNYKIIDAEIARLMTNRAKNVVISMYISSNLIEI